jgi:signal transduction histidine kinase
MRFTRSITLAVTAGGLAVLTEGGLLLAVSGDRRGLPVFAGVAAVALADMGCAVVVALRRPTNPVGPLLALVGLVVAGGTTDWLSDQPYATRPGWLPGAGSIELTISQGAWIWLFVPVAALLLYFPDGRLPGPRYRWVARGLIAVPLLFTALAATDTAPFPPPYQDVPHALPALPAPIATAVGVLGFAMLPLFLALLVGSASAMIVRYRRGATVVRAQVRWLALGGLWLPATLVSGWAAYLLVGDNDVVPIGLVLTGLAVSVTVTIAMLRHELYDVDRAISAAATYGALSVALLAVYAGVSFLGGAAFGARSAPAAAAATALCAAVLAPARRRLQRSIDQRLYPARRAALRAIEELRSRIHLGLAQPEQLEEALRSALRDPGLSVGYRLPGHDDLVDTAGQPMPPGGVVVPVRVGEHDIGALLRGSAGSRELLREIAAAAALLVGVVALRIQLGQALREAEESRARLLRAGYSERRRLERDLHDGAQQRLVSLGMALRLAQRHLHDGTVDISAIVDEAVTELGTAVAELRQIANGIRPSSLDDGLAPALAALAGDLPVPVTLEVCQDPLPDDLVTTAYYVVSEALTNALKHADAERIALSVQRDGDQLNVSVRDNGRGGARIRPSSGLAGLADRVAAAGGALRIISAHGAGTSVEAALPCAS